MKNLLLVILLAWSVASCGTSPTQGSDLSLLKSSQGAMWIDVTPGKTYIFSLPSYKYFENNLLSADRWVTTDDRFIVLYAESCDNAYETPPLDATNNASEIGKYGKKIDGFSSYENCHFSARFRPDTLFSPNFTILDGDVYNLKQNTELSEKAQEEQEVKKQKEKQDAKKQKSYTAAAKGCSGLYVGKALTLTAKLGDEINYVITGLDLASKQVTLKSQNSGYMQNTNCYTVYLNLVRE